MASLMTPDTLSDLLSGLAAGADQHLFSVESWAQRLGTTDSAQQFITQMRQEWQPITVPSGLCEQMMDYGREYIGWHLGWPHLWAHTLRVTGTALALAEEANIDPEHAFLLGIFHDLGKLDEMINGEIPHEDIGAELLREQLEGLFSVREVNLMANVIAKTASHSNPYAQVLFDADKLDKIGATGIARRVSTDWGGQHLTLALRRVRREAEEFPRMHFPTSRQLARVKIAFTGEFLSQVRV